jgi:hypothetical protein
MGERPIARGLTHPRLSMSLSADVMDAVVGRHPLGRGENRFEAG